MKSIHTVCRREVGEIVHPRSVEDESPLAKFGQMMRHKAVHLLSVFLMVYIGVEVTIGGNNLVFTFYFVYRCSPNKSLMICIRLDRIVLDDHSWRWAIVGLRFNRVL